MGDAVVSDSQRLEADSQIDLLQREVKYDSKDFTVELIVNKFRAGDLFVPPYQREFIWRPKTQSEFVESVILGIPIPMMFLADLDDGRLEIVDGAQRIQTLEAFLNDDLRLQRLRKLAKLNGFSYSDLSKPQQRRFLNRPLRLVVLDQSTSEAFRQELFKRVNQSGVRIRPSEARRGVMSGPFMTFVGKLASDPLFLSVCPITPALLGRRENEELILRFLAYSDEYLDFVHDVEEFLDDFVARQSADFARARMQNEFDRVMRFAKQHFPHGFAKDANARSTPRVRFEALSVGANLALRERPALTVGSLEWMQGEEFAQHVRTHASNSLPRLAGRIEFVRDRLLLGK